MKRSVKDRYDVVTDSYFALDRYADYTLRSEDAIIKTSEWYTPEEMPEVRKLMDEQHEKDCKGADDAFDPIEKKWKKYWSAREFLKIVIRDVTDEEISNGVRKDCRLFQTQVGLGFLGTVVVEVSLSTKGLLQLSTPVMNFFPHYWSTTPKDIWETARQNQIDDNSTVYIDDINEIVQNAIRRIKEEHKESYPDYKTTLNSWNSAINRKANGFAGYIAKLYKDTDQHFTAAEIKEKLKESFATAHELGEAKEKLFQLTKMDGLDLLAEILSERSEIKDIYDSLPKRLAENIKEVRKEKIFAANEAKYAEAVKHYESNDPKVIQKAEEAFASLGSFKDAKTLLKHCSTRLEGARSKQYDEAISLKADGTENSINRAIEILSGLGAYKDAQQKVSEYKKELERRHKLEEIKTLSQSNSLTDLSRAIKMLEEFRAESANAEALINQCSSKIESIKVERYAEAISLAEEGTESSINSAILKMEAIDPYKDSGDRIAQFRKQLENEKAYLSAVEHVNDSDFGELEVAKVIFEQLGDYKDSAEKAVACDKRAEELKENMYLEARNAEKTYSLKSQTEALAIYRKLGDYKDSADRMKACDEKCEIIRDIHSLNKEIENHKSELSALKGAFKGKERKNKESQIFAKEQRVTELKAKLTGQYKENEEKTEAEKLAELDVTASVNAAQAPATDQIFEPDKNNVVAAASGTPKKKKSKAGIIIAILIILALLAVGFVKIALPRIVVNHYNDSFDEEETVQEMTPEFEAANVLSFEEVSRDVTEFDTGEEIHYVYKVKNNGDKPIWEIESQLRYYDANGKTLCENWDSYRGNLEPGKWAYIETYSNLEGKNIDSVADVSVKSYTYYIDNQSYTLDLKTNSYESYNGVLDDMGNTDFNSANILDVELEDGVHVQDGYYVANATVKNTSKRNLKGTYVSVEFFDEEGNSIERTTYGVEIGPEPGKSKTIEVFCSSNYADKVKSAELVDYEYDLDDKGSDYCIIYPQQHKAYDSRKTSSEESETTAIEPYDNGARLGFLYIPSETLKSAGTIDNLKDGLYIYEIVNPALTEAGLQLGDRLLTINGEDVGSHEKLQSLLSKENPGEEAVIVVSRNNENKTIKTVFVRQEDLQPYKRSGEEILEIEGNSIKVEFGGNGNNTITVLE